MRKKAVLFTVITFMLLVTTYLIVNAYLYKTKQMQTTMGLMSAGYLLSYYADDVGGDVLGELLAVEVVGMKREGSRASVNFTGGVLNAEKSADELTAEYRQFIEDEYAAMNNVDIELEDFGAWMNITPYGMVYRLNTSTSSLTNPSYPMLESIYVKIIVNESRVNLTFNTTPTDSGGVSVWVDLRDRHKYEILEEPVVFLNPTDDNNGFVAEFDSGASITVEFGRPLSQPGMLLITAEGLRANVSRIDCMFNQTIGELKAVGGMVNIEPGVFNVSKRTRMIIGRET